MKDMRISRRQVLKGAGTVGVLGALGVAAPVFAGNDGRMSWDICPPPSPRLSARASDGSTIAITGSGTFVLGDNEEVTGGGTWETSGPVGAGNGTYQVTRLLSFKLAPGGLPDDPDARAGLAFFAVRFSPTGKTGVLTFGCKLIGTPETGLEGIHMSMSFWDFFNTEEAPFTIFHVLHEKD